MQLTQLQYLKEIGIDVWVDRNTPALDQPQMKKISLLDEAKLTTYASLEALQKQVTDYTFNIMHETNTQYIFGTGDVDADWLIIGEATVNEEDKKGDVANSRAALLFHNMLLALGLVGEQVFITNILKMRAPNKRDPKKEDVQACSSFLKQQIDKIQPKVIVCFGHIATLNLLQDDTPIGKMRGEVHTYPDFNIPVVATYHPAYLLRAPKEKRKAWEDLKLAMKSYQEAP
ncbi:MAG: uracil-DNA glycosylase [Pseudomonadota bacterium]